MANTTSSREISWWAVQLFVDPWLQSFDDWPTCGTPAWVDLDPADPRKWAALLSAARHWALRAETDQETRVAASLAIAAGGDWSKAAQQLRNRAAAEKSGAYVAREVRR